MSRNYQIATEFVLTDRFSPAFTAVGRKMQAFEQRNSERLAAAQARFNAFGQAAKKAAVGAFGAVAGSAAYAIKQAVPLGMELEQNLGGTEAVFGEYAKNVQKAADSAYKNMGLSASDYMATANKMGSLFQGSGLEQVRAMELSTQAMQRAADVASVMGIDTGMAMESIAGAAKGNFTMMDNLGVAMNATTLQAYALEKGINFKWKTASNAEKAELAMQMFFERTAQYAGNFAKEADGTLAGSFGRMKTSVQNILANMALGRSIEVPLANMQESVLAFAHNIVPAVVAILNQLPELVSGVIASVGPVIKQAMGDIRSPFGQILVMGLNVINMLWKMRVPILLIAAAFFAWQAFWNIALVVVNGIKLIEFALGVGKGIALGYQAAQWGVAASFEGTGIAATAGAVGLKIWSFASGIASAATSAFTTAMGFLNAVFIASPIGWIILAIVAAIALLAFGIYELVNHWDAVCEAMKRAVDWLTGVRDAVDAFFTKIRNMNGIAGVILQALVRPFEMLWGILRGVIDTFEAFRNGGFLNGIKMLGLMILKFLFTPIQALLDMISLIPGIDIGNKARAFFENTRTGLLNSESLSSGTASEQAPTRSQAAAESYSREESVSTSRVELLLGRGISANTLGGAVAPNVTISRGVR